MSDEKIYGPYRLKNFISELKDLEKKYCLEIDHHGEFVSYLRDTSVSNNNHPVVAVLYAESILGEG